MFLQLDGQCAVVTGGSQGIGEGIVRRLAQAGAHVVIADLQVERGEALAAELREAGQAATAISVDVTDSASVAEKFGALEREHGGIDILVNNAGIAGKAASIWEQSDADWDAVIGVDLSGVFYCCRAVARGMTERNYGRIVNVASVAGKDGNPNMAPYSAAKAGVIALSKSLGKELAQFDICVNAVTPAVIRTPILDQLTPEQVDYMTARIPRGRTGTVEEVAAVVHFLASKDASFVTAQTYDVSGGRSTF